MIREIPFQCNLENPVAVLEFKSELSKIVKHYDPLTISEGSQNLSGKNQYPYCVFNWIPVFNEMATGCVVPIPVTTVDDF